MRLLILSILFLFPVLIFGQTDRIIVDANFEDWADVPVLMNDSSNDNDLSNVDFTELKIANDAEFVFFKIDIGTELNLQSFNKIALFIDADNNPNTGITAHGIGSEIIYDFGERDGTIRVGTNTFTVFHDDIGLYSAPTVTGSVFEIAIRRDLIFNGQQLFSGDKMSIVFEDDVNTGDRLPNASGGVEYTFTNENFGDFPKFSIEKQEEQAIRVMSYNVLQDGLFESNNQSRFQRIFQATNPQIIGFQEIYDHTSAQVAARIESFLPSAAGEQWYHKLVNPDIICVSRFPIVDDFVLEGSNGGQNNGAFLLDLGEDFDSELLFLVAHTPCCDNDFGRQQEVDNMMAFIRDSKSGDGDLQLQNETPIIIVGDMNIVGDRENYETLLTGDIGFNSSYGPDFNPDWDGSDFEDAEPTTTFTPLTFTWSNPFGSFSPGKLDVIIYSGSVMEQTNAYSLYTAALSQDTLNAYNLQSNDTPFASDHLPLIADFTLNKIVSTVDVFDEVNGTHIVNVSPNPVLQDADIQIFIKEKEQVELTVWNTIGQQVLTVFNDEKEEGTHIFKMETNDLPTGTYIVQLKTETAVIAKKIQVVK
jgi:exonuclease III